MSEDRPRPWEGLTISESGLQKINQRGYTLDDAEAVHERDPFWAWQEEGEYVDGSGHLVRTKPRWRMVGRGPRGVILSVVIELPGASGTSEVVINLRSESAQRPRVRYAEWSKEKAMTDSRQVVAGVS